MASRYWVGGGATANWNATGNTNWSATDGGANNASVPAAGDDVFLKSAADCTANVTTADLKSFDMTGYTGTLSSTGNIRVRGLTATTNVIVFDGTITWTGTLTLIPTTSTANINLTTNGKLLGSINFAGNASATTTLQDNLTFRAATVTMSVGHLIDFNGFTVSGDSTINRILFASTLLGSQVGLITLNGGTFAYADFRDIALSASADLSAITGLSGDGGGNTNITFTTAQDNYWVGDTGSWSDVNEWANSSGGTGGTGRIPLLQDTALFDDGSFSTTGRVVTQDMARLPNVDWSGYTEGQTPTWSTNTNAQGIYGSLTLISGMTFTTGTTGTWSFIGRRGTHTITSAGKAFATTIGISLGTGSYTQLDAFVHGASGTLTHNTGTWDMNDFNLQSNQFDESSASTRTLNMGSGSLTQSQNSMSFASAGLTLNEETSTLSLSSGSGTFAFGGASLQFYNIIINTGTGQFTMTGSNTFNTMTWRHPTTTKTIRFTGGTTQTVNSLVDDSNNSNEPTIKSVTDGVAWLISQATGTVVFDNISLQDSTATGGATFYAGANSTDVSGNSGWIFTDEPSGALAGTRCLMGVGT